MFTRAPIQLTAGWLCRVRHGRDFEINQRRIAFEHLHNDLAGLRIAHLSDPHVGELVTPAHLEHIVDAVNAMNVDLVAVTGDFIDVSNDYLPAVVNTLRRIEAPLGAYFVLGNHDYLDDADQIKSAFVEAGLNLLLNRVAHIDHRGCRIALGGIDWTSKPNTLHNYVAKTAEQIERNDLSILLAHHPHAFDAAVHHGFDLTLAGHTHGGQLLLSNRFGTKGTIGLANLAFRYTRGLYQRGMAYLHVSSGVGSWFPWRFRCPAEITELEILNGGSN